MRLIATLYEAINKTQNIIKIVEIIKIKLFLIIAIVSILIIFK